MSSFRKFFFDWIVPLAVAVLAAVLINKFVLFKIKVPSESMVPTIEVGDQIFTYRLYKLDNLKRGDYIVFYSDELKMRMIKRLVGLPGEKVELKDGGKLYVNGVHVEEPYVINKDEMDKSFQVPEGHYLFLGDNRPVSCDARLWKNPYIPANKIEGKAFFRIFPLKKLGLMK